VRLFYINLKLMDFFFLLFCFFCFLFLKGMVSTFSTYAMGIRYDTAGNYWLYKYLFILEYILYCVSYILYSVTNTDQTVLAKYSPSSNFCCFVVLFFVFCFVLFCLFYFVLFLENKFLSPLLTFPSLSSPSLLLQIRTPRS
jgi:hypothetical protein